MKDRPFEFRADTRAASPLYMQLAQKLAQAIRNRDYQPDEALPSERVLSESLSLSRVTAPASARPPRPTSSSRSACHRGRASRVSSGCAWPTAW